MESLGLPIYEVRDHLTNKKIGTLYNQKQEPRPGDVIVLSTYHDGRIREKATVVDIGSFCGGSWISVIDHADKYLLRGDFRSEL